MAGRHVQGRPGVKFDIILKSLVFRLESILDKWAIRKSRSEHASSCLGVPTLPYGVIPALYSRLSFELR